MIIRILWTLALCAVVVPLSAQSAVQPRFMPVSLDLDSGPLHHPGAGTAVVWSEVVHVPGATSLALRLDRADLEGVDDFVEVTNPRDGEVMRVSPVVFRQWAGHTAHFNGDTLLVRMHLGAGSRGHVAIGTAIAGVPSPALGGAHGDSICGSNDDRVPSQDPFVFRLLSTGVTSTICSGSLVIAYGTFVSAGSCIDPSSGAFVVAQFRVPASTGGEIQHPPVADQYPISLLSVRRENAGLGNNWAVGRLHPNAAGETAASRQGSGFVPASSIPAFGLPMVRMFGHGDDPAEPARRFVQQVHSGPLFSTTPGVLGYEIDALDGSEGSPLVEVSSGRFFGIHTNGGCGSLFGLPLGANSGTAITAADFSAALNETAQLQELPLAPGFGLTIPSVLSPAAWVLTPTQGQWNIVALSSASDWDLETESRAGNGLRVASAQSGPAAEVLFAAGALGTVDPVVGRADRRSGAADARLEARTAEPIQLNEPKLMIIDQQSIVRAGEFTLTTSRTLDVLTDGPPGWRWRLMSAPQDAAWRNASGPVIISGVISAGRATGLALGPGRYLWLATKDGGPESPAPNALSVTICDSAPPIAITATPVMISPTCRVATISPEPARWNGFLTSSPDPWNVAFGTLHEGPRSGILGFVANGVAGTISPTEGTFSAAPGSAPVQAERMAWLGRTDINQQFAAFLPAGRRAGIIEIESPDVRAYRVTLDGSAAQGVNWRILREVQSPRWRSISGTPGGALPLSPIPQEFTLNPGRSAVVVYRSDGAPTGPIGLTLTVCEVGIPLVVPMNANGVAIPRNCIEFDLQVEASAWNAVGVSQDTASYEIQLGGAIARGTPGSRIYLLGEGRSGPLTPRSGTILLRSGQPAGSDRLVHAPRETVIPGLNNSVSWGIGSRLKLLEFTVAVPGRYDLSIEDANSVWQNPSSAFRAPWWNLHRATGVVGWRFELTPAASNSVQANTRVSVDLTAGTHAIVIASYPGGEILNGVIRVTVTPTPHPAPILNVLTPAQARVGDPAQLVRLTGANFSAASMVLVDGQPQAALFVDPQTIDAYLPASLFTAVGPRAITVVNPPPGGGSSAARMLEVVLPTPVLQSLSPDSGVATPNAVSLVVRGTGFGPTTLARWNGAVIPTVFVSSTELQATVPAGLAAAPGTSPALTVETAGSGGGVSASLSYQVLFPIPQLTSSTPDRAVAGSGGLTIDVQGTGFFAQGSTVLLDGLVLPTLFVHAQLLRATLPSGALRAARTADLEVRNPAPGGGPSQPISFFVQAPEITGLTPPLVPVQPATATVSVLVEGRRFHPASVVYANSDPLPTTYISSTALRVQIAASAQPALQVTSGLVLSVANSAEAFSNLEALRVGNSSNRGLLSRTPVATPPGTGYAFTMTDGSSLAPFAVVVDFQPITATSIYPFIDPQADYALNVRPLPPGTGDWLALLDGIGLYGPAQPGLSFDTEGRFQLPGFVTPAAPIGLSLTLQSVSLDPAVPVGYRLSVVRHADRL